MYLALLAQMEDKYPPHLERDLEHRRALARAKPRRHGRGIAGRIRLAPHFGRGRPAATTESC